MNNPNELIEQFGKRIQRCYGCFIAYYMKDMWLGEDATYFCEHCKSDSMFHFNDFSQFLDLDKMRKLEDEEHHH
jgi:hypothetical protein